MESNMTSDMHLEPERMDPCHPYGVSSESVVGCAQEFHNLLNVRHPYGVSPSPVGTQDIKQVEQLLLTTNRRLHRNPRRVKGIRPLSPQTHIVRHTRFHTLSTFRNIRHDTISFYDVPLDRRCIFLVRPINDGLTLNAP